MSAATYVTTVGHLLAESGFTREDLHLLVGCDLDWHRFRVHTIHAQKDCDISTNTNSNFFLHIISEHPENTNHMNMPATLHSTCNVCTITSWRIVL